MPETGAADDPPLGQRVTDAYLDAHPALDHALREAWMRQAFPMHLFAGSPERQVLRAWRDPAQRRAMAAAYAAALLPRAD